MIAELMTKMPDSWYELVTPETRLTQGDFVLDCPVLIWDAPSPGAGPATDPEILKSMVQGQQLDLIVLSQACDLKQEKVREVILCPAWPLSVHREAWQRKMEESHQIATSKAWKKHFDDMKNGYQWNLALLDQGRVDDLATEHRVVDFHEVYSMPRAFLECLLQQRSRSRLRLLSPYREHLSQGFARFFMRVGLPTTVSDPPPEPPTSTAPTVPLTA